ncbi:MAG TPA: glutamine--fructose-6-phosphate aminotransferase, partial [Methylomirabilota bacterium]|nr:glutamine--fructose-6-phosphate aminotransferase [Methylomirabilota bacterium]
MCGIIGYVGSDQAVPVILDGLRRLEYRGYDSAGMAILDGDAIQILRAAGKLRNLEQRAYREPLHGTTGIGHTRWATHGGPTDRNAHPHADPTGRVAVVHNGIIENYQALRATFDTARFASDTDTEVVAHLVAAELDRLGTGDLLDAVRRVVGRLDGAFSLCIVATDEPGTIVVARRQSPLIVAHAEGVGYCASDVAALISHTRDV